MNILITGARSGIGLESGLILAKKGHKVFLTTRTVEQKMSLEKKIKKYNFCNQIEVLKLDINKEEDRNIIKNIKLDTIINNAAIGIGGSLLDIKVDDIRENFETNFFSTLELSKIFIETNKEGNIVIIGSIAGLLPLPYIGSYASTKAALIMLFTILRQELFLKKSKIRIKIVEPGLYKTGFNQVMMNEAKESIKNNKENNIIGIESNIINLFESKNIKIISKKVAKAATSKSIRLKYRAPIYQVISTKLYMLLFK